MVIAPPFLCPKPKVEEAGTLSGQEYISVHTQIYEPNAAEAPLVNEGVDPGTPITQVRVRSLLRVHNDQGRLASPRGVDTSVLTVLGTSSRALYLPLR